jgi:adenylate cyclase
VYFGVVFDFGLLRPTLRPLEDVAAATARVRRGDVHTPVPVSSLDELGDLAAAFNEMQRGLAERESLQAAFGSYVDPALARRLVESGSAVFEGEELELTVLFVDVRDFTSYAELVTPAGAVEQLNRLFEVVVPVLHEHGGHANHYLGDGLLAVFGAPEPLERHADEAVAAAVAIHRGVRAALGPALRLGIGINSGPVIAGTVGGGGRHEFTVIGDTVNTAARVEQLTKETGDAILMTEATRAALSSPKPRSTKRGAFDLKGKAAAVTVHAVNPFPRSARQID